MDQYWKAERSFQDDSLWTSQVSKFRNWRVSLWTRFLGKIRGGFPSGGTVGDEFAPGPLPFGAYPLFTR